MSTNMAQVVFSGFIRDDSSVSDMPGRHYDLDAITRMAPANFIGDAFMVASMVMSPRYEAGAILYTARKSSSEFDLLIGQECVVTTSDGRTLLRHLQAGNAPQRFALVNFSERSVELDAELVSAAPVVWSSVSHRAHSQPILVAPSLPTRPIGFDET